MATNRIMTESHLHDILDKTQWSETEQGYVRFNRSKTAVGVRPDGAE